MSALHFRHIIILEVHCKLHKLNMKCPHFGMRWPRFRSLRICQMKLSIAMRLFTRPIQSVHGPGSNQFGPRNICRRPRAQRRSGSADVWTANQCVRKSAPIKMEKTIKTMYNCVQLEIVRRVVIELCMKFSMKFEIYSYRWQACHCSCNGLAIVIHSHVWRTLSTVPSRIHSGQALSRRTDRRAGPKRMEGTCESHEICSAWSPLCDCLC